MHLCHFPASHVVSLEGILPGVRELDGIGILYSLYINIYFQRWWTHWPTSMASGRWVEGPNRSNTQFQVDDSKFRLKNCCC